MSIDSYFKRNTKVIDDEPTPQCSPRHLESSESTTTIPATQATPPKASEQGIGQQGQLPPIPITNSAIRAGWHGGEGGAGEGKQAATGSTKKSQSALHRRWSSCCSWSQWHSSSTTHDSSWWWWCFCRHFANSTRWSGKRQWGRGSCGSSCYKETAGQQPLPSWLLQDSPLQLTTPHNYPKDLPQGTTLLVKEWLLQTAKKKDTGEEFKTYDLVMWMVASGMACQSWPSGGIK